jgi:hypothetical protein
MWLTTLTACYIVHVVPYEEPLVHKLELFNEVTTNLLFSMIYAFAITPEKDHDTIGLFFMIVILFNVCTHLYFLLKDVCKGLYAKCRNNKYCRSGAKIDTGAEAKKEVWVWGVSAKK